MIISKAIKIVLAFFMLYYAMAYRKFGEIFWKKCTALGTFKVVYGKSFLDCIDECQRRQRCEVVMYKHGIYECNLKDYDNMTFLVEGSPVCIFTNTSLWEYNGICTTNMCGKTETCIESSTERFQAECLISECPLPVEVENAYIMSNVQDIGSKTYYKCQTTYIGIGNPYIACRDDGMWSPTDFICGMNGTSPTADTEVAYLINVTGEPWITGTTVTYKCRPTYQGLGTFAKNTVDKNGNWTPSRIYCCNENMTDFVYTENQCHGVYHGGVASTKQDMTTFCENKGGYMKPMNAALATILFNDYNFTKSMSGSTKEQMKLPLRECFVQNNFQIDISNYTFENLLDIIALKGFTTPNQCSIPEWFAPTEPNGGDVEDCIGFWNGKAVDISCSLTLQPDVAFICSFDLPSV